MTGGITLSFNLSVADVDYAEKLICSLVDAHRTAVDWKMVVIDACPQEKPSRFRIKHTFEEGLESICHIAEELKDSGYLDKVHLLTPDGVMKNKILKRYFGGRVDRTHDDGGAALFTYAAAIEMAPTRYLLHYDADMLLYQESDYDWALEGVFYLENYVDVVSVTPRISPPFAKKGSENDAPSRTEGRKNIPVEGGWLNDWFSTRCFLLDREKFEVLLPLIEGFVAIESRVRKWRGRGYPIAFEQLIFRKNKQHKKWRLNLNSEHAWLVHPPEKGERFVNSIDIIQGAISKGVVPDLQRGKPNLEWSAWQSFVAEIKRK